MLRFGFARGLPSAPLQLQDLLDEWLIADFTDRECPDCTFYLRRYVAYMSIMDDRLRSGRS